MNKEAQFLLNVLDGFINEKQVEIRQDFNWNRVLLLANIHSVSGILGYMMMKRTDALNREECSHMRQLCFSSIALFSRRAQQMEMLIQKLNQESIDHLLFKGFVLKDYYEVPELRTFGDIDFLIKKDDRQKCHQLMLDLGFHVQTDWEPVYSYNKDTEYYEIHTDVMEVDVSDKADYKDYYSHVWEHALLDHDHTWQLTPEFHFLYLLTHIAKHISASGAGIRMYMDIAFFIKHFGKTIDWNYISEELEKLAFKDFANMVLTVVETYFHINSPLSLKKVDNQILKDFIEFTMEGGTFGHFNRDAGVIALKKHDRNEENVSKVSTLLQRLFPSASSLEKRYTYLQNKHWLLPFAWIHRFFKTKSSWKEHSHEAKNIIEADNEEVLKLKRIYKEIGL